MAEYDKAKELVGVYTKGSERPEEVQARKEKVKWLLRHDKLVKPEMKDATAFAVTDVMPEQVGFLIKNLEKLIKDGDLTKPAAADDDLL